MKAIEILKQSFSTNMGLAESYNRKAKMHLSVEDFEYAESYKKEADDFIERAKKCQEAIEELEGMLTLKTA